MAPATRITSDAGAEAARGLDANRGWFACGALMGLAAVSSATVAAHLPEHLLQPGGRESLRTAAQILGWHAAALLAAALWLPQGGLRRLVHLAACCFVIGSLCFCTGVDVPALGGPHLGRLAPTGGSLLLIGWALLAASTLRRRR